MAALRILVVLALAARVSYSQTSDCSYSGLLKHLNLDLTNTALQIGRPVKTWTTTTLVQLKMILDGILDVDEKFQTVTNHIWIEMYWVNEYLTWNTSDFCGMKMLTVPSSMLWMPDIIIQEDASDTTNSQQDSPVSVFSSGLVNVNTRFPLTYACMFNLYRFPFDTQTCNITFSSLNYDEDLPKLEKVVNDTIVTELSDQITLTEGEWKITNIESFNYTSVTQKSRLVYTISLRRKPFLYVINLILPLLFLLVLDLASFFVGESGSEKLGFKVTILLSIFVLLLILKDILPSTEDRLPLIAIYCLSVFTLVWINVLETMLMSFLINLFRSSEVLKVKTQQPDDNHKECSGVAETDKPDKGDPPLDPPGDRGLLKLILAKLTQRTPERRKEKVEKLGCSGLRLVKIFDSVFFVLYFTTVVLSQVFLFTLWNLI